MNGRRGGAGVRLSRLLFRGLLFLYPRRFRERFGDRMLDDFSRMYEAERGARGRWGLVRLWALVLPDTARAAFRAQRALRESPARRLGESRRPEREGRMGMGAMMMDLRTAVRGLARRPGYSGMAVATLALAIGANTALFSVLDGVLLRPLPYPDPDRLALVSESAGSFGNVSYPNYRDWKDAARSFEELGALSWTSATVTGGTEPLRVTLGRADPSFMRIAGLIPVRGRGFVPEDDEPGAASVVVLSHGIWQQSFGGDPAVIGQVLGLDGTPFEIVGVLAEGVDFGEAETALWTPLVPTIGAWVERREVHALTVLGRLAPTATMQSAHLEMAGLGESLARRYPEANAGRSGVVRPLETALLGDVSKTLWLLMGMVGLVLLIACFNVAGLLLVRVIARRGELAMRRAIGASRWDVIRLLVLESMGLTLVGGALGVGLAYAAVGPVVSLVRGGLPRLGEISVDTGVLLFALVLSVLTGLVFGLLPGLSEVGRGTEEWAAGGRGRVGLGRSSSRLRTSLTVGQVAGAVVLLVGTGLLMRSFQKLQSVEVGFDPQNLGTMAVSLSGTGRDVDEVILFYRELPSLLESVPGVRSAAAVNALPISGGDPNGTVTVEGFPFAPGEAPTASYRRVTPGYFATMSTPILHGRAFRESDVGEPMVTIINESMARLLWDDPADAVGDRIKVGPADYEPWLTVVGVAGDMRNIGLDTEPLLATYEPHAQRPWTTMTVVYRTEGDPALVTEAVRRRVRDAGGDVPVYEFTTLAERISESLQPRRIALVLTGTFALMTLLTASIGLYGLLAYTVAQRTPELGVRLALGAGEGRLMRGVAGQAARTILGGIALGLAVALGMGPVIESLLHDVSPRDPPIFVAVPLALALASTIACFVPVRAAARIDPAVSLRKE